MIAKCPKCKAEVDINTGLNYCPKCSSALVLNMKSQIELVSNNHYSIIPGILFLLCIPVAAFWYLLNKNNSLGVFFFIMFFSSIISYPVTLILQYVKYRYIVTKIGVLINLKAVIFIVITGSTILVLGYILVKALIFKVM